jgi:hypothetical protein
MRVTTAVRETILTIVAVSLGSSGMARSPVVT